MKRIGIIGAGAAGLTAAFFALKNGAQVTLFEKNKQAGRKICITGKGRCNLTNDCEAREFLSNVVSGSKFLSSAIYRFPPEETIAWFESLGLKLKTERGRRVFPETERASDVRDALVKALISNSDFRLITGAVTAVSPCEEGWKISQGSRDFCFDSVILATGGASYPLTGSTGDGYEFARRLGHTVTDLSPSLVRVVCAEKFCREIQGLSLKNVRLSLWEEGQKKPLYTEQGEMLFTDDGVSGPLVLSASAHLRRNAEKMRFTIDFKPALTEEVLDKRLLSDFAENSNRCFKNSLDGLLPAALRPIFVRLSGIDSEKRVHQISRAERQALVRLFKEFPLQILHPGPMEEAIVTAGGILLNEVDPRTLQSKLHHGLYFAGELLDVDAYTGGFNLQIAFSTGKLAGESAAL